MAGEESDAAAGGVVPEVPTDLAHQEAQGGAKRAHIGRTRMCVFIHFLQQMLLKTTVVKHNNSTNRRQE
jgi:hypothetical protein